MATKMTKDLGVVTAYGYALLHGFGGTEEEFGELLANVANNLDSYDETVALVEEALRIANERAEAALYQATQAAGSASAAELSAQNIENSADQIATNQSDIAAIVAEIGDLDDLQTTSKDNIVDAINEAYNTSSGGAVQSVNGQTGAVVLDADDVGALPDDTVIPTKTSDLTNDSGFITSAPVASVNGATGTVVLTASDVGALPSSTSIPSKTSDLTNDSGFLTSAGAVTSFNGATGAVVISAATTSANGLMSATDKSHLDAVYADYSSALTALGV